MRLTSVHYYLCELLESPNASNEEIRDSACDLLMALNDHYVIYYDLVKALEEVRLIISDGAMRGFVPSKGDWAQKLFESQAMTKRIIDKVKKG